jgi:DNA-binding MarR family transcriptional regulator
MAAGVPHGELPSILCAAVMRLVQRDGPDLTTRQLGVFLTCYLENEPQTVRGLAACLGVSKPAITRALDRLTELDLVRRKADPLDRRGILVQRTPAGMALLRELRATLRAAATAAACRPDAPEPVPGSAPASREFSQTQ